MKPSVKILLGALVLVFLGVMVSVAISVASPRAQIRVVGSSTVFPFVAAAAEQFGLGGHKTPIVEATGTGGGFKLFCSGVGETFPDVNNASRPITESEVKLCEKNGVKEPVGLAIGYDGIVFASAREGVRYALTKEQIFKALARQVPDAKGALVANPYKRWKDIHPALPDAEIIVYGPPPTSGTRDAFVELVMEKACEGFSAFEAAYPDKSERKKKCHVLREDGAYMEAGEDDNMIIQKLQNDAAAMGIVGYSFFEENKSRIQAATVEGELPSYETIETGRYKVARSLYMYVKREHLPMVKDLGAFAREVVSDAAIGEEGYLTFKGLLPMPESVRKEMQASAAGLD
jgi:phosphate transport system substrate-binding protein